MNDLMSEHHWCASGCEGAETSEKRMLTAEDIDRGRQKEAKTYARLRQVLLVVEMALGGILAVAFLVGGISAWMKESTAGLVSRPPLMVACYFVGFWVAYGLLLLPVDFYSGFTLPHRYGLSTQTLRGWIADQGKGALLSLGVGLVVVEVIYYLLRTIPSWWWLVTALFMLFFTVLLTDLAPVLVVPLFFKLTPLRDEELVRRLTELAERVDTKVRGVFTINLSSRTRAANAMLMGLGRTRRIVLGDTLYADYDTDEIETILAHELGHHVRHDMWWGIAVQSGLTLVGLYLAHVALGWGVGLLGFSAMDDVAAFPLLVLVMGGFMAVTTPLMNAFGRWREGLADEFALQVTGKAEAFVSAMVRLANQNLADVDPERWVEVLLYSHPPISKRIEHGESFRADEREMEETCGACA